MAFVMIFVCIICCYFAIKSSIDDFSLTPKEKIQESIIPALAIIGYIVMFIDLL